MSGFGVPGGVAPAATPQQVFEAAVQAVFKRWTLLRLAVEQGWADGDGEALASELLSAVLRLLLSVKKVFQDEVEDLLFDTLESKFNTLAEDGSVEEVSTLLLRLRAECATGNFETAADVVRKAQAAPVAGSVNQTQPDVSDAEDDDDDEVRSQTMASRAAQDMAPPLVDTAVPHRRPEPVIDEDGFQQVVSSRSRSRRGARP